MQAIKPALVFAATALLLSACRIPSPPQAKHLAQATSTAAPVEGWSAIDRRDPTIPDVIVPADQSYAVDPNWQVAQVDYVFRWWGLADPVFDAQHLTLKDGAYIGLTRTVALTEVASLVANLNHLHPASEIVGGQTHTDDYPSWHVRLTGTDGREVSLTSNSTVLPNGVPWSVYANGRLFAQFDGALAEPLFRLFQSPYGQPAAAFFPGGGDSNRMPFQVDGLPPEITIGFSGLSAIREGFGYQTQPISKTLDGIIVGRESIAGLGHMIIGTITNVVSVQIAPVAGEWLDCPLKPVETRDAAGAVWSFSCAVDSAQAGQAFRYPIRVSYQTEQGAQDETTGVLMGAWQGDETVLALQPSEELQAALDTSPIAQELFAGHVLGDVSYVGSIVPNAPSPVLTGTFSGEAILLGSTRLDDALARYALHVPFTIDNGHFARLPVTRAKLDGLLRDVLAQPLTRRVLSANPNAVLMLYYDEPADTSQEIAGLLSRVPAQYHIELDTCGGLPGEGEYPRDDTPFRAWGFSESWQSRFDWPEFMLIDQKAAVLGFSLYNLGTSTLSRALLPKPLTVELLDGVTWLSVTRPSKSWNGGVEMSLPDDTDAATLARIKAGLPELPAPLDTNSTYWVAKGIATRVNDDGTLEMTNCQP